MPANLGKLISYLLVAGETIEQSADISGGFTKFGYNLLQMRNSILLLFVFIVFASCKKDKFTTAPQLKFVSVQPSFTTDNLGSTVPTLTFEITDQEGDIGFRNGLDTSFIYMKNNLTGNFDSLAFPDLETAGKSSFQAEVTISLGKVLKCKPQPGGIEHTDTLFFDIYVTDFAKNKSNVMTSGDPVLFLCQ